MSSSESKSNPPIIQEFLNFLNDSPSQFHAVQASTRLLVDAGFESVSERDAWSLKAGGKYFFTRNQSSIVAFALGNKWKPGNGFIIEAAHTDSPVLKVKPISKVTKSGFLSVGVEPYGGGLWTTWFDRDLSIAGRVIIKNGSSITSRLLHIRRPLLRIPMLAIHLQRDISEKGFNPNKQSHLLPFLATEVKNSLNKSANANSSSIENEHHTILLSLLAKELSVQIEDIQDFELSLCDTQPSTTGGVFDEFLLSGRLDNLCMSFISIRSLIDSTTADALKDSGMVRMAALFDNEEVGSGSCAGAGSNLMVSLLGRINNSNDLNVLNSSVQRSLLVSADMAHAVHPNYSEVHEENHRPSIHGGLVIKYNGNQRYATNSLTALPVNLIAKSRNIKTQKFCVRNDSACGSTIGPILAANTGIRTVDVGVPQLSMHSIREMAGVDDIVSSHSLLTAIFHDFEQVDNSIQIPGEQNAPLKL